MARVVRADPDPVSQFAHSLSTEGKRDMPVRHGAAPRRPARRVTSSSLISLCGELEAQDSSSVFQWCQTLPL